MRRPLRIVLTLALTGLALGYLVWKVDLGDVVDTLLDANPWWFALSIAIMIGTALPMALRWQWLMRAQGMDDTFAWLTRAYFVSYTASQVLPTSIGGDAMRVYETARRHPGRTGDVTAIILLERGLGGAGTVLLGAIGFLLALGTYDVGAYLWLEGAFVLGTLVLIFLFFARSATAAAQPRCGRSCVACASSGRSARSTTASITSAATPGFCSASSSSRPRSRPCGSSRSGPPAARSGSTSGRGSTT